MRPPADAEAVLITAVYVPGRAPWWPKPAGCWSAPAGTTACSMHDPVRGTARKSKQLWVFRTTALDRVAVTSLRELVWLPVTLLASPVFPLRRCLHAMKGNPSVPRGLWKLTVVSLLCVSLVRAAGRDWRVPCYAGATLAGRLEATMASLEGAAALFEKTAGRAAADPRTVLPVRRAGHDPAGRFRGARRAGRMAFIGPDPEVRYFAEASRCLAFHPPKRVRGLEGLALAYAGAPLQIG
jgi:hypothetical protein